jgi:hypothetical protein
MFVQFTAAYVIRLSFYPTGKPTHAKMSQTVEQTAHIHTGSKPLQQTFTVCFAIRPHKA